MHLLMVKWFVGRLTAVLLPAVMPGSISSQSSSRTASSYIARHDRAGDKALGVGGRYGWCDTAQLRTITTRPTCCGATFHSDASGKDNAIGQAFTGRMAWWGRRQHPVLRA